MGERRAEGDIEENWKGCETWDSSREVEVATVSRAIAQSYFDLFLHHDTGETAPREEEVAVGVVCVDNVTSVGAGVDVVAEGIHLFPQKGHM